MIKVSVIMSVYNGSQTINESILSIINQTYNNWELIICDDGSLDNSLEIINIYSRKYSNIFVLKNEINMGLNFSLNKCLAYAKGKYVARMDADDISLPNRLSKQVEYLDKNTDVDFVSCPMIYFDKSGEWGYGSVIYEPTVKDLIKGPTFCHGPAMIRKTAYDKVCGYSVSKKLIRVEDYHLWYKMFKNNLKGRNLDEYLYKMRDDRNAYKRRKYRYRINESRVKTLIFKDFNLPIYFLPQIFRPLIIGLLPSLLYTFFHKKIKKRK